MSNSLLIRRGWWAALISGAAWALSALPALIFSVEGTGSPGSPADFFIETMHFIAEAFILVALIGYRARMPATSGRLGQAGFWIAFAGDALLFLLTLIFVVLLFAGAITGTDPGGMIGDTIPTVLFMAGLLGTVVGFPMLAIASFRTRAFPWWVGVLMLAYPVLFFLALLNYGIFMLIGLAWLGLGSALRTEASPAMGMG